jgi:hypothetical protein
MVAQLAKNFSESFEREILLSGSKNPPMIHIHNQMNSVHILPPLQYYSYIYAYVFQMIYAFSLSKKKIIF